MNRLVVFDTFAPPQWDIVHYDLELFSVEIGGSTHCARTAGLAVPNQWPVIKLQLFSASQAGSEIMWLTVLTMQYELSM